MVVLHFDWIAQIKAVLPLLLILAVLSGEAPQERREETVLSDASRAANISGVIPFLVFGCKETVMMMMMMMMIHTMIIMLIHVTMKIMRMLILVMIIMIISGIAPSQSTVWLQMMIMKMF